MSDPDTLSSAFNLPSLPRDEEFSPTLISDAGRGYCRVWVAVIKGRRLILKSLSEATLGSALHVELLRREYETARRLSHPSVVAVHDFREFPGLGPCIVMEYVEGVSLRRLLSDNPGGLPFARAMNILSRLCDALDYLHAVGVTHRDLKPSNIMVTPSGHVRIIDFGLSDNAAYVDLKYAGGTPRYGAPEQFSAGSVADYRCDIYSLGVIMRELCRRPPLAWRRMAARCSAADPERRPGSAGKIPAAILRYRRRIRLTALIACLLLALSPLLLLLPGHSTPAALPVASTASAPSAPTYAAATPAVSSSSDRHAVASETPDTPTPSSADVQTSPLPADAVPAVSVTPETPEAAVAALPLPEMPKEVSVGAPDFEILAYLENFARVHTLRYLTEAYNSGDYSEAAVRPNIERLYDYFNSVARRKTVCCPEIFVDARRKMFRAIGETEQDFVSKYPLQQE